MSDPLIIGVIAEGPGDFHIISAIIEHIFEDRRVICRPIQPELSAGFVAEGQHGGWGGVYAWFKTLYEDLGPQGVYRQIDDYHALVVQVDYDVHQKCYSDYRFPADPLVHPLPCHETDLPKLIDSWRRGVTLHHRLVLCLPKQNTDAWVLAALHELDAQLDCEALLKPDTRFSPKIIRKKPRDYLRRRGDVAAAWPRLVARLPQARRFDADLRGTITPHDSNARSL